MPQVVRTFVAVELPGQVHRKVNALVEALSHSGANVKWVETENLHLTLKFLGDIDLREVHHVCRAVEEATREVEPFELLLRGAGAFPDPTRPRTLWIGVDTGVEEMVALQTRIEDSLHKLNFPRENRRFTPHLTIGRVKTGEAGLAELEALIAKHANKEFGLVEVDEVTVFSSQLYRKGPLYDVLSHAKLKG